MDHNQLALALPADLDLLSSKQETSKFSMERVNRLQFPNWMKIEGWGKYIQHDKSYT